MTDLSRREILASAAGVSALGLTGQLAFLPAAHAADLRKKGYYSYKIGDIEVTSIYDGVWKRKHGDDFALGASVPQIKDALRIGGETDEYIPIEFAFTAIKTGGKTILIDAGQARNWHQRRALQRRAVLLPRGSSPRMSTRSSSPTCIPSTFTA